MGQGSSVGVSTLGPNHHDQYCRRSVPNPSKYPSKFSPPFDPPFDPLQSPKIENLDAVVPLIAAPEEPPGEDATLRLTDDCLGCIFNKLSTLDRNSCALVCRRWLRAEAQARDMLILAARADLVWPLSGLLDRFRHVTKLALRCDRGTPSIGDGALFIVGKYCVQLQKLKLKGCRELTDKGLEEFAIVCGPLKKFSAASCGFGAKGLNSVLENCKTLEDLTVKRLRRLQERIHEEIGPGYTKLKRICLKDLGNAHAFQPLISNSKHLKALILCRVTGNWDRVFENSTNGLFELVELRMEKLDLGDRGLQAIARCCRLQILHVGKSPNCTDLGISAVARGCRSLRKLHVDGCSVDQIGDEGLKTIAEKCSDLQELVLIRLNARVESLMLLGSHCTNLERLALCNSITFGDSELSCIAFKCSALKKLCIKCCPISDKGLEALAAGCPQLTKVKIKKCRGVSSSGTASFQMSREGVAVLLDTEKPVEVVQVPERLPVVLPEPSSSTSRSPLVQARLALAAGGSFVACTLLRRSNHG